MSETQSQRNVTAAQARLRELQSSLQAQSKTEGAELLGETLALLSILLEVAADARSVLSWESRYRCTERQRLLSSLKRLDEQSAQPVEVEVDVIAIIGEARMHMAGRLDSPAAREITGARLLRASAAHAALASSEAQLRTVLEGLQAENLLDSDPCDLESTEEAKSAARNALAGTPIA